ncbi:hypothetical protein AAFF_G00188460 [Aldrovandia affinis]|uniref:Lysosomal Pro-X carboxypeptidase n=1 Tax=Aldrovandia affinis TaxID=143900 RepID=A0AAD7SY16_9TELE|nr:hypothetical protein AAFF_G00188460 [Aldrovandia affinis]
MLTFSIRTNNGISNEYEIIVNLGISPVLLSMSMEDYDHLFKIVLIGNAGVGKTCLVRRFTQGLFPPGQGATIGVDFMIKTVEINGEKVKLQIWDTAGQERFRSITQSYYRSANALILTYDITCEDSFRCLPEWLREIEQYASSAVVTVLVGNKIDLTEKREVLRERAEEFAEAQSMLYLETSAKESDNVEKLFLDLACKLIREAKQNSLVNNVTSPMPGEGKTTQLLYRQGGLSHTISNSLSYKTYYFEQKIDHFGFLGNGTFKQRYLLDAHHWHKENGPILFYTGNEGDITWFCNNTGFMWDVAEELGAMLVFAEHRYYGESLPFGQDSYSDAKHLNYLTSEQALADFAVLIKSLKSTIPGARDSPVIAIGGSYGGMLAAWMRMKYPHIVSGALAASAPIWQFTDMVPCGVFYQIVTQDFRSNGVGCAESIQRSWKAVDNMSSTVEGLQWLSSEFGLCIPLKVKEEAAVLKSWLQETWVNLAMVDYPYAADFLQPLPRWPIKVVCRHLTDSTAPDEQLLHGISQAVKVYYNYTGSAQCLNMSQTATGNLGYMGWYYQACTEMVMPMCTDGIQDMFEPQAWDFMAFSEECQALFGVRPRSDWADTVYGGKNIKSHSNIVFSNGGLDPWSGGGVTKSLSDSLVAIMIPEGAHHLDLRFNSNFDPQSVLNARAMELKYIKLWIQQAAENTL